MSEEDNDTGDGLSRQTVPLKKNKFICIYYPGIVKNVDRALMTLGGIGAISKTYSDPCKRLELRWRPGDCYCKPSHGDPSPTSNFLLKVRRRKVKGPDGKETFEYRSEIEGVICFSYKFVGLADFQYLPVDVPKGGGEAKDILPLLTLNTLTTRTEFLSRPAPLFVLPILYSRIDTAAEYLYRHDYQPKVPGSNPSDFRPQHLLGTARRKRTIFTIFVNFEDNHVPLEPLPGAESFLRTKFKDESQFQDLKKLFEERPVWSKSAIKFRFPKDTQIRLKYALPLVAYYMLTGPWRTLWVRLGYNPRTEPSSKMYQVLDFRIRRSLSRMKQLDSIKVMRAECSQYTPMKNMKKKNAAIISTSMEPGSESPPDQQPLDSKCIYRPHILPPQRQMYYQLCDIQEPEVQTLLHSNDGQEKDCDKEDGFCVKGMQERCREILFVHVNKLLTDLPFVFVKGEQQQKKLDGDGSDDGDSGGDDDEEEDSYDDDDDDDDDDELNDVDLEMNADDMD